MELTKYEKEGKLENYKNYSDVKNLLENIYNLYSENLKNYDYTKSNFEELVIYSSIYVLKNDLGKFLGKEDYESESNKVIYECFKKVVYERLVFSAIKERNEDILYFARALCRIRVLRNMFLVLISFLK